MALANSNGIFDSWSPQMILSCVIDNGRPSPEPLSVSSLAGAVAGSGGWLCGSSSASLLDFAGGTGDDDDFEAWMIDAVDSNCSTAGRLQVEMMKTGTAGTKYLLDDQTSAETADGCTRSPAKSKLRQKHPILDCDLRSPKKRCGITTRTAKDKQSPSKDPQSIAAKNRRERISERLRILQDLVPNGTKVDLVTMLEKAINYVKFLQLQVKVLATDEFWPAQGGIAPDVAQAKKAIDAILS